jgi:hypothetical protein
MLDLRSIGYRSTLSLIGLLLLLGGTGCGGESTETEAAGFEYGLSEMRATAEGTWTGAFEQTGHPATTMTLVLTYSAPQAQPACGNRTLGQPLCIDMSSIGIVGTLTTADGSYDKAPVTGSFNVEGTKLVGGDLFITLPDGLRMGATYQDKHFTDGTLSDDHGSAGTFTMARQ